MEEVPDEDFNKASGMFPLPKDHEALLLTHEEFKEHRDALKGGKTPPKNTKPHKNAPGQARDANMENTNPEKQSPGQIPGVNKRKTNTFRSTYVEPDTLECQPTSSKVKIEDLVTDNQETNPSHTPGRNPFWDRPIPKPQFDWPYDPRMPSEWNEVIAAMRAVNSDPRYAPTERYRMAEHYEVSEPEEFTNHRYPDQPQRDRLMKQTTTRIKFGDDISELNLAKLRTRFENSRPPVVKPNPGHSHPPKKGKGRAEPGTLSEDDYPHLRQQWHNQYIDILQGVGERLPPFREVNHEINLIDDKKQYRYHTPRCHDSLRPEFHEKLNRYVANGWWEPRPSAQAAPLLCIFKKDRHLRTVIDARQRNDNTIKDVTPMPDQEVIREDVARAKIRSKIDLSDAYEQVRVQAADVHKTAFATISGTYVSHVMQQGDCNAPATFQRLMTSIFRDLIGRSLHVYLDDLFVYSNSIEEHEQHLQQVFERLQKHVLTLKWEKCDLYASRVDCLGHIIDDNGIHVDSTKLQRILEWRTPRNYNDIQRFVGLVNYLGAFLPDVTAYTGPLMSMLQNGTPFYWRPIHQRCFDMIKRICSKTPIIQPIDPSKNKDPIWLICDASKTGVGAMYGQGPSWQTCRPAGFMSKKFTPAQQNYAVHELETLAILEALLKWEDKLIGYKIHIITDHKALEFFKTQPHLSNRQRRWMDYLSRFDFDITYVKGEYNKVADCLSRYYESDNTNDTHDYHEFVRADVRIDPSGEDLPELRFQEISEHVIEIRTLCDVELRRSRRMQERREEREVEAQLMAEANARAPPENPTPVPISTGKQQKGKRHQGEDDPTLGDILFKRSEKHPPVPITDDGFKETIRQGYHEDLLFQTILECPEEHNRTFTIRDGLIWRNNTHGDEVPCIPRDRKLIGRIIDQAHMTLGHFGELRTGEYIRKWYWWPRMASDIHRFCKSCQPCQKSKASNQKPFGKLHSLPIPNKPWDSIGMDFVGPFPESKGYNYLWVIICRMTSMVHLIPIHTRMKASELSWIYRREVVRLHGLPSSIVSDRDSKFTSKWWRELHRILGAKLLMSTSFHPQTDGQTERANRTVGQIFRSVVQNDQKDWVDRVDMTEFAINASVSGTTGYAPFELNGGYMPSMIREIRSNGVIAKGVKDFAQQALMNLAEAHDAIIESHVFQTRNANTRRSSEPTIDKGDLVFLSTKNLNLPKGRARKLCPKFIGPYKVLEAFPETSDYILELPEALRARRIHSKFHVALLRPYHASDDALFPNRVHPEPYDFGAPDDQEWFVDEITAHRWVNGKNLEFEVWWSLGDSTWEPYVECKKLEALERYLELQGAKRPTLLAKKPRKS